MIEFSKIDWGEDAAEQDKKLNQYFFDFPEFSSVLDGKKRYIIGRKGSGKTALLEQVQNVLDGDSESNVRLLSLKNFPINDIRGLKERGQSKMFQFVPIWMFLILIELASQILRDESVNSTEGIVGIKKFINENFPDEISFSSTIEILKNRQNKLKLGLGSLSLENGDGLDRQISSEVHYQKVTEKLITKISQINSRVTYYFLFDDLDEGYRPNDDVLSVLHLSLINAIETLVEKFRYSGVLIRPILAIRTDIFEKLKENNLNKTHDFQLHLKWESSSLLGLLEKRLIASFPNAKWDQIYNDGTRKGQLWNYINNRTLKRPRDVIKFMKCCSEIHSEVDKLSFKRVKAAEGKYSAWLFQEFRDEIFSHIPIWEDCMDIISDIGEGDIFVDKLQEEFEEDEDVNTWMKNNLSFAKLLQRFYKFGLIGIQTRSGKTKFFHDGEMRYKKLPAKIFVNYGLHAKLGLRKNRDVIHDGLKLYIDPIRDSKFVTIKQKSFNIELEELSDGYKAWIKFVFYRGEDIGVTRVNRVIVKSKLLDKDRKYLDGMDFSPSPLSQCSEGIIRLLNRKIDETPVKLKLDLKIIERKDKTKGEIGMERLKKKLQKSKYLSLEVRLE